MKRALTLGVLALAMAGPMGCGDVEINAPTWPEWTPPKPPAGEVHRTSVWRGAIPPGQQIEIKGIYGEIRATRTAGTEVVVTATRSGDATAVDAVTIDAVTHGSGVTICAVYPDVPGHAPNVCAPGDGGNMSVRDGGRGIVRVTFAVELPDGVVLVGKNVNGEVDVSGVRSDAFLSTINGGIRVSTTQRATARTVTGSITASIGLADWGRDLEFTTTTGDVHVTIPAATNAAVRAASVSGQISSDFPLSEVVPGQMQGTIGNGGPTLRLTTLAGNITLRRGS
ncbi:MAG: DUF4097 domain-containing protein [Gemmatimonadota bacterium]|nr:DUF4097 domain-containing protein [Gemmatimonadota bacterium]